MNSNDQEQQPDFFISYTSADRPWAEWIASQLEAEGFSTLLQAWDFLPGQNFVLRTHEAAESERMIAVLSPAFFESKWTMIEWASALAADPTTEQSRLVPIRVRQVTPRGLFRSIAYIDLVDLDEVAAHEKLLSELRSVVEGQRSRADAPIFPGTGRRSAFGGAGRSAPPEFPGDRPPVWNVPPAPGRFVGREQLLDRLAEQLAGDQAAALTQTQAVHGLGGVGKTRLAVEFARRHRNEYDVVWWVRAEDEPNRLSDYAALASALGPPEAQQADGEPPVPAVRRWLEAHERWLLVFDNAPGPEGLEALIPSGRGGQVLVTSRREGGWGGLAEPCPVDVWSREESVRFLLSRTGSSDAQAAVAIAEALGDLPLALEQAGAYADSKGLSLASYERRLRSHAPELFALGEPHDYKHTVATTWELAFAEIEQDRAAASLLLCAAFLAPEAIPGGLFESEALADGAFAKPDGWRALDDAREQLRRYSLLTGSDEALAMHRLVQQIARERLNLDDRRRWVGAAQQLVAAAFPADGENPASWPVCARLLPHGLAVAEHAKDSGVEDELAANLLDRMATYLLARGEAVPARTLGERALELYRRLLGEEHPDTLRSLNNLAWALYAQGDFAGAGARHARALELRRRALGEEHADTATSLNSLALTLRKQGNLADARARHEQVLELRRRVLGEEHPDTLTSLGNLATTLRRQGEDLAGALAGHERALEGRRRVLGDDHPDTLQSLSSLAKTLRAKGDLVGALARHEQALEARRRVLGDDHPKTLRSLNNFAESLREVGDLVGARARHEQALELRWRVLGEEHPETLTSLHNLAETLRAEGDLAGARARHKQALELRRRVLGEEHPDTLESLNKLAALDTQNG